MKATKPYFSHDIGTKSDEKIIRLMFDFRKNKNDFSESILKDLVAHAAYGIYWEIIEYLHENSLNIDELDMLADELRIDSDILARILNNYDLFKTVEGKYISERVLKNLKLQEEKSEKARQSANKRHSKNKSKEISPEASPEEQAPEVEYNEEFTMSIIKIYNEKFKKSRIVSNETKQRIFKIHTDNKLTLDIWEKVFSNAKRGWDIGDQKNVPPSLNKILEEWDSFASDDYFLAPDREALAKLQKEKEEQEQKEKEEQYEQRRLQQLKNEEENKIRKERYEAICNKETALEYLYNYSPVLEERFLKNSSTFRTLSKQFNLTSSEAAEYFASRGERRQDA